MADTFQLVSPYAPQGDQGLAIAKLVKSLEAGNRHQTLLGVTGSGKTFSMANIVANIQKPTLVISHNKTLAAQLYSEFKAFFPHNAVEYFVSYFDYYQPEAYIPRTDTFIEKDSAINDEIERHRLAAMGSLLTRRDVLVVASVSCIYGLGSPGDYQNMMVPVHVGMQLERDTFLRGLVEILYERNDVAFERGRFRVRGDVVEVFPAYLENTGVRVEFFGDEIDRISYFDPLTGSVRQTLDSYTFNPAKQFVTPLERMAAATSAIRNEMTERVSWFEKERKFLEAQRIKQRTEYDLEIMREVWFCQGIENYSRHLTDRPAGERPYTLLDFFQGDFLTLIDESHVSIPQIGGMYEGDRARKTVLVDHGFRLPSALDNRPLKFGEFMNLCGQIVHVTATPGPFELLNSRVGIKNFKPVSRSQGLADDALLPKAMLQSQIRGSGGDVSVHDFDVTTHGSPLVVEQIIRPTGLLDPIVKVRPLAGQIDETIECCRQRVENHQRVLVTTLTKRTAEDLCEYLKGVGLKARYIHADIDTIERVEILRGLRQAEFDVLIGINLLREGLDLPEVSLVCVLDADKEGYLRSATSLIQTAGRAARHVEGRVILFADTLTGSIRQLLAATEYRRARQIAHNTERGIVPRSVIRGDQQSLQQYRSVDAVASIVAESDDSTADILNVIRELQQEMIEAATRLEYERAAMLRDQIAELEQRAGGKSQSAAAPVPSGKAKTQYRKKRS